MTPQRLAFWRDDIRRVQVHAALRFVAQRPQPFHLLSVVVQLCRVLMHSTTPCWAMRCVAGLPVCSHHVVPVDRSLSKTGTPPPSRSSSPACPRYAGPRLWLSRSASSTARRFMGSEYASFAAGFHSRVSAKRVRRVSWWLLIISVFFARYIAREPACAFTVSNNRDQEYPALFIRFIPQVLRDTLPTVRQPS